VAYAISASIAGGNTGNPADRHLFVPVAGPWFDLANRASCPSSTPGCDNETTSRVLLIVDGVVQAAASLQILAALIFPDTSEAATIHAGKSTVAFSPTRVGNGYGAGALVRF
jgi:hypothetical protein